MKLLFKQTLTAAALLIMNVGLAQTQTIRGKVIDIDTQMPLPGTNVVILNSSFGTITDEDGEFRLDGIPLGRVNIKVSFIGYEDKFLSNVLLSISREVILDIQMTEALNKLEEVAITHHNGFKPLNEMAVVSARTFSVEETKRYAGAIDDPARMVSAFAGVNNNPEGNNDIIVRGNSPRGVLWRLEGVEIPNPNHFADEGATGGPINALNSSMLGNSDFYTGAFAPEYGNVLSGVFDMNLRKGNNEKREYSASLSTLGLDLTAEGPFAKNYRGSYLANYRYSSLALLDAAGILDFDGVPKYQDLSFKLALPLNRSHTIDIFGLGGISSINTNETDPEDEDKVLAKADLNLNLGVLGIGHTYLINSKTYLENKFTATHSGRRGTYNMLNSNDEFFRVSDVDFSKDALLLSSTLHYKSNARSKLKFGFIQTWLNFSIEDDEWNFDRQLTETVLSESDGTSRFQAFTEWKYRFGEDLTMIGGLHYLRFALNGSSSIEPRLAAQWELDDKQRLNAGFGLHSRLETVSIYLSKQYDDNGAYTTPNIDLSPSRAAHYVMGYSYDIGSNTMFKSEVYYQRLFDIPIENDPTSYFSMLNSSQGLTNRSLVNEGTGTNYGLELTLEQYLVKGFYYLSTVSLYKSTFEAKDGVVRNTAFDGNYVFNALAGKEFKIGSGKKDRTFYVNAKVALIGARPYTPVDLEASLAAGEEVLHDDRAFGVRGDEVIKIDLAIGLRRNWKNVSTEWKIDIQNLTNNKAVINQYFSRTTQSLVNSYQLPILPTLSYRVTF